MESEVKDWFWYPLPCGCLSVELEPGGTEETHPAHTWLANCTMQN